MILQQMRFVLFNCDTSRRSGIGPLLLNPSEDSEALDLSTYYFLIPDKPQWQSNLP